MQVDQVRVLSDQHFKAGHREGEINESVVVHCDSHQDTDQLKVDVWLETKPIEVVELDVFIVAEHTVGRAEQLLDDELEELLADATLIDSWFSTKSD